MRSIALLSTLLILGGLGLTGCQNSLLDPLGRHTALKEAQRKYTHLIRWGDIWRASAYVDPELRDDFLELVGPFEGIRVTDYDIGEIEEETDTGAIVMVTYHAYSTEGLTELSFRERQEWSREGMYNDWQVSTNIDGLVEALGARR